MSKWDSHKNLCEPCSRQPPKCGKQASQKPFRIPATAKPDGPPNEVNDTKSPQERRFLELLGQEIYRVPLANASPDMAAATAAFSENGTMLWRA